MWIIDASNWWEEERKKWWENGEQWFKEDVGALQHFSVWTYGNYSSDEKLLYSNGEIVSGTVDQKEREHIWQYQYIITMEKHIPDRNMSYSG